jgi:hypothetical protein
MEIEVLFGVGLARNHHDSRNFRTNHLFRNWGACVDAEILQKIFMGRGEPNKEVFGQSHVYHRFKAARGSGQDDVVMVKGGTDRVRGLARSGSDPIWR